MFDSIQGRVAAREPTRVVIEAGGLGYLVHVPLSTFEALPETGSEARLLLHLSVREDEWRLFGFASAREREVFRDLLRVSGVGPALALTLLSGLGPDALIAAVVEGEARALTRVKGVGKKTAERVLFDLKDRWAELGRGVAPARGGAGALPQGPLGDALRALESLGLEPAEAEHRLKALGPEAKNLPVGELVRRALRG